MVNAWDSLLTRKLLLVTGKGGIGKTTVASFIGLRAARQGKRVLLVEASAHDQLAPSFGKSECGHVETTIEGGLSVINLNAKDNFREYIVKYLGLSHLFEKVFGHQVVTSFIETIPGLAELIMLGRLFYSAKLRNIDPYDLVVFDGPAFGHFLSLMTTPRAVAQGGIIGPVRNESDKIQAFLSNENECCTVVVTNCDELAVTECLEFLPKLTAQSPSKVGAIVANRLLPMRTYTAREGQFLPDLPAGVLKAFVLDRSVRQVQMLRGLCAAGELNRVPLLGMRDLGALPSNLLDPWTDEVMVKEALCP